MPESPLPRILICCEYATLNGGEHSLLAALRLLAGEIFDFVAAVPPQGPLGAELASINIPTLPLNLRNTENQKLSPAEVNSALSDVIKEAKPNLIHANSLAMGRMLGRIAPEFEIPMTAHLRDIRLSEPAISDLNQLDRLIAVSEATCKYHVKRGLAAERTTVFTTALT
ncbi:MAG: hypothetical protein R3C11_02795 [Planctomycetaceae bacterium]